MAQLTTPPAGTARRLRLDRMLRHRALRDTWLVAGFMGLLLGVAAAIHWLL